MLRCTVEIRGRLYMVDESQDTVTDNDKLKTINNIVQGSELKVMSRGKELEIKETKRSSCGVYNAECIILNCNKVDMPDYCEKKCYFYLHIYKKD